MLLNESSNIEHVKTAVKKAINELYVRESSITTRLNEPSIAFRVAHYLANIIEEQYEECIFVDSEYDKDMRSGKKMFEECFYCCDDKSCLNKSCVTEKDLKYCKRPDILIHGREDHEKDICAIEIKKMSNRGKVYREKDAKKLTYLTCHRGKYKFQLGIFLDIGDNCCRWTLYNGAKAGESDTIYLISV